MKIRPRVMRSVLLLIVLCISLLALSPVKASEAGEEQLKQTAAFFLNQCIQTEDEVYRLLQEQREADLDFMLLQNGIPCGGKDYLSILRAWREGEEECGAYDTGQDIAQLLDSFTVKKRNNGLQLTGEAQFENRSADLTFTFENGGTITALTIGGHYDMGEIIGKAMQNTAIGMGVVFAVLIFMSVIIWCRKFVGLLQSRIGGEDEGSSASGGNQRALPKAEEEVDDELLCIIAAAVSRDLREYPLRKEEENMRKYNITVNGKTYGVEVEEADATLVGNRPIRPASVSAPVQTAAPAAAAAPAEAPAPAVAAAPAKSASVKAAPKAGGGSGEIKAGITGKVLKMNVSAGQAVKNGDTVMILEAMKMEIPIVCQKNGTIAELLVKEGDPVEAGQVLATLS